MVGLGISFSLPVVLSACPHNALNALYRRHLLPPVNKARPFINFFLSLDTVCSAFKREYWAYMAAHDPDSWRVGKGLVKLKQIDRSFVFDRQRLDRAESFIKRESVLKLKKARLIQGNVNEYTAYNKPLEYKAIAHALKASTQQFTFGGVDFDFYYAAGMNHDELSDLFSSWLMTSDVLYFDERDGKNWDSTMQEVTLRMEADVYALVHDQISKDFLKRSSGCRGRIRLKWGFIRYLTAWKRLSGDWNTSVGNTMISMMIVVHAILSLPPHLRPHRVRGLFMGDDYLGAYYYKQLPDPDDLCVALNTFEAQCGIEPIRAIFRDPAYVSFISMGLWPRHGGGYQFVPHPARQLAKLNWTVRNMTGRSIPDQATALAIAFIPVYEGYPLMQDFLRAQLLVRHPKITIDAHDFYFFESLSKRGREVDWRSGFMQKYNLPYTACDWQLGSNDCAIYHHPVHSIMLQFETADPCDRRGAVGRKQI